MKKKTSRYKKGTDFQHWIKNYLEEHGWIVHNQTLCAKKRFIRGQMQYVSTRQDIFSADLVARSKYRLLWIQSTLHPSVQKRYDEFKKYFQGLLTNEQFQLWIKTKSGHINIFTFRIDGYEQTGKIIRRKYYGQGEF